MKAVVMAGGEGSRLRPLTIRRPKPMVPIAGKPVMEHILNLLKRHGITEVIVTVQYLASNIEDYFGNGSQFGMRNHLLTRRCSAWNCWQCQECRRSTFRTFPGHKRRCTNRL